MTQFEPQTSVIGSDCSAIRAPTTAHFFAIQCDQIKIAKCLPLQKLPKNVRDLGKLIVAKGFKKLPKVRKNRPIWAHCCHLSWAR